MFTITEILDMAMRVEENGRDLYRKAMAQSADPVLKTLLKWMADEEDSHRRWFAGMRRRLKQPGQNLFVEAMTREVLAELLGRRTFCLDDVDFQKLVQADQLLEAAIEFETDTVFFYEILTSFTTDAQVLTQLQTIIAEEKNHIEKLRARKGS
jgi:rubrerythrin